MKPGSFAIEENFRLFGISLPFQPILLSMVGASKPFEIQPCMPLLFCFEDPSHLANPDFSVQVLTPLFVDTPADVQLQWFWFWEDGYHSFLFRFNCSTP
jgi:hypothetical protein